MFNLPIPAFDPADPIHAALAREAKRAEALAANVEIKEGEHFTRSRKRIREALIAGGIAPVIEALVAELIGVSPAASLAVNQTEAEHDDAD